jgi:hypothetical protein
MSHQVSFLVVPLVLDGEGLVVPQVVTAGSGTPWGGGQKWQNKSSSRQKAKTMDT